ncbi:MAG: hypothetical protein ACOCYZ_06640 [Halococcoides sp.]
MLDSLVVFVVSLLIGAFGIHVGARVLTGTDEFSRAIVTALVGSIVWVVVAALVGWIPFLGPILALFAYLAVIDLRYPGGWFVAIGITVFAWFASFVVLYALSAVGLTAFEAVGVPGV